MDAESKNMFDKESKAPEESDIFADQAEREVSVRDIFGGNVEFFDKIEGVAEPSIVTETSQTVAKAASKFSSVTNIILIINIVVITGILVFLVTKPPVVAIQAQPTDTGSEPEPVIDKRDAAALDKASSLQLAETLYREGQYSKAHYIFDKLSKNLTTHIPADEFLKDYMQFKIALCLQKMNNNTDVSRLFTNALYSHSPVVRTMANYHLIFIELHNKQYLNARTRAYRTLALLRTFNNNLSPTFEADCYFMLAEALTKHILTLNNAPDRLPGKLWSETLRIETIGEMPQKQLRTFLQAGVYELSEGALVPQIGKNPNLSVGSQWSIISLDNPLEELLTRFASASDMNINWNNTQTVDRNKPVTIFLPTTSKQFIAEVTAGSTGLISRFYDNTIIIYNPEFYNDLNDHKEMLTREAISVWRRFPLRYRGDHRTPNAHYALALMLEYADENIAAMGEYKLIASRYSHNSLAPYALLNSSKIKTNIHDYTGASEDLTELIIQHPDAKVIDQASLYLAEATMQKEVYKDAIRMFHKVYNIDMNPKSQCNAAYGLGKCYYKTKQHDEAKKWLIHAIRLTDDITDYRLSNAYYMLGKTNIELGDYEQASTTLKNALGTSTPKEEYLQIILKLVEAEVRQGKYVVALNILENVSISQLSQEDACKVLVTKSRILRDLDLADTGISLLRRKIEFIADSQLRAELTLELAKAYTDVGDYRVARKELTDIINDLPKGTLPNQANLLLIDIAIKLGDYEEAKYICLQFLSYIENAEMKQKASNYLGQIYTKLNQMNKAALAFAGVFDQTGVAIR